MKNYGLLKFKDVDVNNFTSDIGMDIRKAINPVLRRILRVAVKGDVIVERYPKLEKNKPYVFVSTHRFVEDTITNLSVIDRNAYVLFGTTDQLENNKQVYAAWLNGFIYVNREDAKSRHDAIPKMKRVLANGNSVFLFPEGGFNNTENLLCLRLFSSPYILARDMGVEVVPIAPFYEFGSDKIYVTVGDPIDLGKFENKEIALDYLRDVLATMVYANLVNHSTEIIRENLSDDPRMDYMEERRAEYLKNKWTRDVWDEELIQYRNAAEKEYLAVKESMDNIEITPQNAGIMGPILVRRQEDKRYDFKDYMHKTWNKK